MLIIFMAVAQVFLDSGFGAAIIQKQDVTQTDINSIFYFNLLVGILAAMCLCAFAPWVAAFYDQPVLVPLLRVMSVLLVINAFGLVHNTLLRKALKFKTEAKVSICASLLSGVIGISMAYQGFGVWSLAVQKISGGFFRTTLLWFVSSWQPAWLFSTRSLRSMFGFGSKLLCASLLNTVFDNIYYLVIGKLFSPASLGYYARADNFQKLPSSTISSVILRVAFPIFSTIQDDTERVKRGMKMALTTLALINFPIMIGLAMVARPLVLLLLTDKWLPSVPYLQLLCLVGLFYPLNLTNMHVHTALGRPDLYLRLQIINKVLITINIILAWRLGIMALIAGQVIISLLTYLLAACHQKSLIHYSAPEQIRDLFPYLMCAILMGAVVYLVSCLPIAHPAILLMCQVAVGVAVYVLLCRLFRLTTYMEIQKKVTGKFVSLR